MKNLYRAIIAKFELPETKAKFTEKEISPVTYIDLYAGQEQFEENFELFSQPAILVDWDVDYQTDPAMATVTIYCCYEQLRDTSNISLNRELGLKFLDYVAIIDEVMGTVESETTGKLDVVTEGFHKMDSIVDVYLLTYECSFKGRKNPLSKYQEGDYDKLGLTGQLVQNMNVEFDD
jgi:hypothetical protein